MEENNRELIQQRIENNMKKARIQKILSDARYLYRKKGHSKTLEIMRERYGWRGILATIGESSNYCSKEEPNYPLLDIEGFKDGGITTLSNEGGKYAGYHETLSLDLGPQE